ncbi:MAG: homoserine O-succinyltransferase [Desulfarculales bacterium]|nr:homoserine O-succinyltransferase [Desulfarculales bacterium]
MPINIPKDMPAKSVLDQENVFVMTMDKAVSQDIRPLSIAIVNLMPTKIVTETQLLRMLSNSPLQVNPVFVTTESYQPSHVPMEHLERFYVNFSQIKDRKFDGMIITGAPVENIAFEDVDYWDELKEIIDFSHRNVFASMYICWGAQAALYHRYGVPKHALPRKMFGIFEHRINNRNDKIFRGFDDVFFAPHSRHTEIKKEDILRTDDLKIVAESPQSGIFVVASQDGRQIYVTGHLEYDADTLHLEYMRDMSRGLPITVPRNYYPHNNPKIKPLVTWRAHGHLFFSNWLNYCVYQETPFEISQISDKK